MFLGVCLEMRVQNGGVATVAPQRPQYVSPVESRYPAEARSTPPTRLQPREQSPHTSTPIPVPQHNEVELLERLHRLCIQEKGVKGPRKEEKDQPAAASKEEPKEKSSDSGASSTSSSSDDEEDNFVAKCPDRGKKKNPLHRSTPYQEQPSRSNFLHSGGTVFSHRPPVPIQDLALRERLPKTVEEVAESSDVTRAESSDFTRAVGSLGEEQLQLVWSVLDNYMANESTESSVAPLAPAASLAPVASLAPAAPGLPQAPGLPKAHPTTSLAVPIPPCNITHAPRTLEEDIVSPLSQDSNYYSLSPSASQQSSPHSFVSHSPQGGGYCGMVCSPGRESVSPRRRSPEPLPRTVHTAIQPDGFTVDESSMAECAEKRLRPKLNRSKINIAWEKACITNCSDFIEPNRSNQTKMLEMLESEGSMPTGFMEELYVCMIWMRKRPSGEALRRLSSKGRSALVAAALVNHTQPHRHIVARLIADTMVSLGLSPDEVVEPETGNTLVHLLAGQGDSHYAVLAELLCCRGLDGGPALSPNRLNAAGQTPLHVAATAHTAHSPAHQTVTLLLKHRADPTKLDQQCQSPLHLAVRKDCDPRLVKALLQNPAGRMLVNLVDAFDSSPLHYAAARNDLPLGRHIDVVSQLITSGAKHDKLNRNRKVPLNLVAENRKEDIKKIFHRKC